MKNTYQICISGQVQGVGFRPFVYRLAVKNKLHGKVYNSENGVIIKLNCTQNQLLQFKEHIINHAPPAALIQQMLVEEIVNETFNHFAIVPSATKGKIQMPLTADFAICSSCQNEILDDHNRRYGYPFTTCTQCGPRYALTMAFPFEREHTSLSTYTMCSSCLEEYQNPLDTRFHSQTNTCANCGIKVWLSDAKGQVVAEDFNRLLSTLLAKLSAGEIIGIKNTNGYLLCADALNTEVILKLRTRKGRPTKPFALLYPDIERIQNDFNVSSAEKRAITSSVAPIVILTPKSHQFLPDALNPGLNRCGVMLPSSALLKLLVHQYNKPLIATSGNLHGSPIISNNTQATEELSAVVDAFVHHDLELSFPQDDSVMHFAGKQRIILRRSRGLAPNYMQYLPQTSQRILAMGADLKSTFAFSPNGYVYVSSYLGNLANYDVYRRYKTQIEKYQKVFSELPSVILIDKHPQYQSTLIGKEMAQKLKIPVVAIQHHKAHFASVLAEHQLWDTSDKILGVIWDGTGYGDDQMIWGGEFFVYQNHTMTRHHHFEYFPAISGDKMAMEPRIALAALTDNEDELATMFSPVELKILKKTKQHPKLFTSSVGRLFDAAAACLGLLFKASYEGEAAMLLESEAWLAEGRTFSCLDSYENLFSAKSLIQSLDCQKRQGIDTSLLAANFMYTLAYQLVLYAKSNQFNLVACSGGVFQNRFLVEKLNRLSKQFGVQLFYNKDVSPNDENISLGQLAYYEQIIKRPCV